jgi:two-component system sensor histidine kinase KdpD
VVVGAIQRQVPPEVATLLQKLEVVPLKDTAIDVEALLRRHPAVCFIDGLAYNNPPGARNSTRWEDVRDLVATGIKVITSINIQYVAELREQVEAITGKHVTETVPIEFIKSADEIEIVDAEQGNARLRELALVLAADVVDHQLTDYLDRHGIQQHFGAQERILVCITPRANVREMIAAARTIADRFHGELVAAYVNQPSISPPEKASLDEKLALAQAAGARVEILDGDNPADAILQFARNAGITQLFIGHSERSGIGARIWGNPVDKLIRGSHGMDVRIFPH